MEEHLIIILIFGIIAVTGMLVALTFFRKRRHDLEKEETAAMDRLIINGLFGADTSLSKKEGKRFIERFTALKQSVAIDGEMEKKFRAVVASCGLDAYYMKRLKSKLKFRRIEAGVYLGIIGTEAARKALEQAVEREKSYPARLYLISSLVDIGKTESIPIIVKTILDAPDWYREKVREMLYEFGTDCFDHFAEIKASDRKEHKELIIGFAEVYPVSNLIDYLRRITRDQEEEESIRYKAATVLTKIYALETDRPEFMNHADPYIRGIAVQGLGSTPSVANLLRLIPLLADEEVGSHAHAAIAKIIAAKPPQVCILAEEFHKYEDEGVRSSLAELISKRIDYMMLKVSADNAGEFRAILKEIMLRGHNSSIIGFLNKNRDSNLESAIIPILKEVFEDSPAVKKEYRIYLDDWLLKKCDLTRYVSKNPKKEEKHNKRVVAYLYFLVFVLLFSFLAVYAIRHRELLMTMTLLEQLKVYVVDFNYYLIYYTTAVNGVYLFLLFCSFIGVTKQAKYWNLKKLPFLFRKKMLPSVSIIAPAFNEEATIIESANSLLNLRYPDYELIIVNDGSKDSTIQTLIQYFKLEKVDVRVDEKLKAMPIRGIYRNVSRPKLTVVDKENGGKADSLNTGINISSKDYFCGIDSDSLLETDALLKLTSLLLDEEVECPAMGGNIFPINGCAVDNGKLASLNIPDNHVAKLQTIEYIRAFMAGRVGWAQLNCLLIISGAFGLFKKDRIIEIGGYLTSSGKYNKDTVGEDMELVVRLNRHMLEQKQKFKIKYAYNANCWTEVPESFRVLKSQRDRWHRGLIDILTFHHELIGNPRYGRVGLIAMPYFFIFEMMGPLVEIQGYIMVALAAVLGLLNQEIALLLFASTILMGILISVSSLYLAEKESDYFSFKELAILVLYAFMENFGVRQLISLWRVTGYINSLKKPKGWGKMERKGFAGKTSTADFPNA